MNKNIRRFIIKLSFVLVGSYLVLFAPLYAEEEVLSEKYPTKVVTKRGLSFRVPEDMPIEVNGGLAAPLPLDEYVYRKFKKLEDRMSGIEKRLRELEESEKK